MPHHGAVNTPVPPDEDDKDDLYTRLNAFRPPTCPKGSQKRPCPDCSCCQFCSDSRCDLCRAGKPNKMPTTADAPSDTSSPKQEDKPDNK